MNILRRDVSAVGRLCFFLAVSGAVLLAASACGSSNSTTTAPTPSAPYSALDVSVGTGATANIGNTIRVSYTGWLYDPAKTNGKGTQFDTNQSYTLTLGVTSVIQGWVQGIPGMKVGGTRRLTIPPELAYGVSGSGQIPGNATLVFDVTLLQVQ